jgi:hypothetical protein
VTPTLAGCALCPACRARLDSELGCASCGQTYPRLNSISVLLTDPLAHVELWRMQLGLIIRHATETNGALRIHAAEPGIGRATRTRLDALAHALAEQVADVAAVVVPAVGDPLPPHEGVGLPRGAGDYLSCIFRDWAWSDGHDAENDRSLAAVRRISGGESLGRVLVLGAGACRLAYDLHVHCGATETAVVDIDPFLLVMAEAVIRGAAVSLTETSVNAPEVDPVSRAWRLALPGAPLGPEAFHFFLADGLDPPFADRTFDTVVTPWFIDQVPADLEGLLGRVHRLLLPGGRWINHGPLLYRSDALPITRWYTRQELFELAATVGFRIGRWEREAAPHLVSPLTGRGLIENVVTFEASREASREPFSPHR